MGKHKGYVTKSVIMVKMTNVYEFIEGATK